MHTRRQFLLGGASLVLAGCTSLPLRKLASLPRIIVIGAGISGLSAARHLVQSGKYEVILLESRSRIGGRVHTVEGTHGQKFEMGASWIHGIDKNPIYDLCRRYGVPTEYADNWSDIALFSHRGFISNEIRNQYEQSYENLLKKIRELKKNSRRDMSLQEAVTLVDTLKKNSQEEQFQQHFLHTNIGDDYGADLDNISLKGWENTQELSGGDYLLGSGYSYLAERLAEGLTVLKDSTVARVEWGENKVSIISSTGQVIEGEHVIITVPLGVLKKGSIQFSPSLPEWKKNAIYNIGFGSFNKTYITYDKQFWSSKYFWFEHLYKKENIITSYFNMGRITRHPTLIGLSSGRNSEGMQTMTDNELKEKVRSVYTSIGGASHVINDIQSTRWSLDPFALGSYSYPAVGETHLDRLHLQKSVGKRLHFAGEACRTSDYGTVHGAWLSGKEIAEFLIQQT